MSEERMLVAAVPTSDSSPVPLASLTADDLKLDSDISSAAERRVAESVSQELDYWEKLVFSFDMERDKGPGGPSQSETNSNARGRQRRREQSQTPRVPSMSSASSSQQQHRQQSLDIRHAHSVPYPLNYPGQSSSPQLPPLNQLGNLDPYTLAHLAALSALQQGQSGGPHFQNAPDPVAVLRQLQGLLYPPGGADQGNPNISGTPLNFPRGFLQPQPQPQAQPPQEGSSRFTTSHQHTAAQQTSQLRLPGSSDPRWELTAPGFGQYPFYMDPSLLAQIPSLSPLLQPNSHVPQSQTPGAGPSGCSRARSRSTTASTSNPSTPISPTDPRARSTADEGAIVEDKRRRNTLASARFRIKKKHKILALERSVVELEARADDLEREASELRRENGWLKEMLIMKGRTIRAQAVAIAAELVQAEEEEEEEEEEESGEEGREELFHDDEKEAEDVPDSKGKGKEKAT